MSNALIPSLPELKQANAGAITEYFRSYLQQVVTLHTAMFEKLLFEGEGVPLELAELFEDAGNTYITLSERISKHHLRRGASKFEEQLDANIEPTLRRV
ncbi:hypothetical protein [Microvirga flavescens]|uniref:hypothetical protein n=1 Tax=Microvirga flavescens TaxID=2249811 RepID=UPI000DDBB196|nr:hypothetical protein [Microvirga flavescens]